jgi:Dolichyl-phosphate-mannose-protein mannosyltransferase
MLHQKAIVRNQRIRNMGMEPKRSASSPVRTSTSSSVWTFLTALAALIGLALIVDASLASSATYDEVAYIRIAAKWWRTGDQSDITRMGSPLTFWKLQQVPVLWLLDHIGQHAWIDNPMKYQQQLLPLARLGSAWIWVMAFIITVSWSKCSYGPRAMALAAWLFALSPNLLAHGALATMELPLVAGTTAMFWLFWRFLKTDRPVWFWASAVIGGLAFSCKFTTILVPPILTVVWWVTYWKRGEHRLSALTQRVALSMVGFLLIMLLSNAVVTGFACLPLSSSHGRHPTIEKWFGSSTGDLLSQLYEVPIPQDWVGFATQMHHQASGGPSYLFGERRMNGWWYYYLVAVAVKVPLTLWLLITARLALMRRSEPETQAKIEDTMLPFVFFLYMIITALGSSRNYGIRYLLPLAPLAIVWISALGEECRALLSQTSLLMRCIVSAGLAGYVLAVATIHPHELTYFNTLGGGSRGGRYILADSNLDWGQGLKSLARLQNDNPEFSDITLYYFGDTKPAHYGVSGLSYVINAVDDQPGLSGLDSVKTQYLAVSASLQWGPWGPPGLFRTLNRLAPLRFTDDTTIAIYLTDDLKRLARSVEIPPAR